MGTQAEDAVRTNMESLRLFCDREIPIQQQKMDALTASFRKSLESIRARAQETVQNQGERSHVRGFVSVSLGFLPKLGFFEL
jgi:kinetochore protein Spc25